MTAAAGPAPYHGIYPVLYSFFDAEGRIDRAAMAAQVEHCIAAGAHGIAILGLVSEVHKMDVVERRALVEMVGALIAGRIPYAVTIAEPTIAGQVAFARAAAAAGADWVILQPPAVRGISEGELIRFFGAVADALAIPVAIQNNPVNLDVWLSVDGLTKLAAAHANITLLKGEGFSVDIARVIEATSGRLAVFGGHGGLEFLSLLRSGGAGLIPAPDCVAVQVRIFRLMQSAGPADQAEAERLHGAILPMIVFMTRAVPSLLAYGKRLMARRLGLGEVHDRPPAVATTRFGMSELARFEDILSRLDERLI